MASAGAGVGAAVGVGAARRSGVTPRTSAVKMPATAIVSSSSTNARAALLGSPGAGAGLSDGRGRSDLLDLLDLLILFNT